jgi:hypothetical protein
MKNIFRLSMVMAILGLFVGIGFAGEPFVAGLKPLEGEDPPAVAEVTQVAAGPVMTFGSPDYMEAMEKCTLPAELCGTRSHAAETDFWMWPLPGVATYEYGQALETGNLPSLNSAPAEEFATVEIGGIPYRIEIDLGGN